MRARTHTVLHLEENILSVCGQYAAVADMRLLEEEDIAEITATMTRVEGKRFAAALRTIAADGGGAQDNTEVRAPSNLPWSHGSRC